MKSPANHPLSHRVVRMNVGFLLAEGVGNHHDSTFDIPEAIAISDDLVIRYLYGTLRLSRMKEGLLVEASLQIGIKNECSRCADPLDQEIELHLQELFTHPYSIGGAEFFVGADAILDLAPLLRAEILIETSHKILCSPECRGLCHGCGANLNRDVCRCDHAYIDPRLAKLRELLNSAD